MKCPSSLSSSSVLLARLRQDAADADAWRQFVLKYGPCIVHWCRHWGLQDADAHDVAQNVLLRMAKQIRTFQYDPAGSFRAWLRKVAHAAWCDFHERRKAWHQGSGSQHTQRVLETIPSREDLQTRLEEEFDRELLELAMARVAARVQWHTWEAFRLLALEDLSGAEAAARLDMKLGSLFAAKSKVQRLIQQEIRWLEAGEEPTA